MAFKRAGGREAEGGRDRAGRLYAGSSRHCERSRSNGDGGTLSDLASPRRMQPREHGADRAAGEFDGEDVERKRPATALDDLALGAARGAPAP